MQVGTHRQYIMPHTGELPPNLANSLRQAQTALTVAKGWAEKHYGPRLHPNTFTILSSLTYDPAALNDIHGSESHRDSPAADAVTRPSTEVELDVRDESQFPKLSRPTAPPTRSLYMGSRPTLTEQYPQIRNKSTPISHIAPKPEQLAICNTERRVTSSTPLPPRHTGPIKGNRTGANCPSIHTPNSSLISSDPPTLPGAGRLAGVGPGTPIPPLPLSPPSVLPSPHNCSRLSDLSIISSSSPPPPVPPPLRTSLSRSGEARDNKRCTPPPGSAPIPTLPPTPRPRTHIHTTASPHTLPAHTTSTMQMNTNVTGAEIHSEPNVTPACQIEQKQIKLRSKLSRLSSGRRTERMDRPFHRTLSLRSQTQFWALKTTLWGY